MRASEQTVGAPQIIDWDRAHPLLAHVELGNVDIADSLVLRPPAGATMLIDATAGPIAAIAPREGYQDAVLGFEIVGQDSGGARTVNTNWPRRLSFPTFWLNVLEYLAGGAEAGEANRCDRAGRSSCARPAMPSELTVIDPKEAAKTVERSDQDVFPFHDTETPGVYQVRKGDQVIQRFAVNLFDRAESNVRVVPSQENEEQHGSSGRHPNWARRRGGFGRSDARAARDLEDVAAGCPVRTGGGMVYLQSPGLSVSRRRIAAVPTRE